MDGVGLDCDPPKGLQLITIIINLTGSETKQLSRLNLEYSESSLLDINIYPTCFYIVFHGLSAPTPPPLCCPVCTRISPILQQLSQRRE